MPAATHRVLVGGVGQRGWWLSAGESPDPGANPEWVFVEGLGPFCLCSSPGAG